MDNPSDKYYREEHFLLQTLEPVHVGTGGNRLGRVDNSIVREPGTRLPKIPGTALHGAIRHYAAVIYEDLSTAGGPKKKEDDNAKIRENHPVNYTFGSVNEAGDENGQSGKVSIGDARLLLFPVYSLAGPVWITCPGVLEEFGIEEDDPGDQAKLSESLQKHPHLNLGWLMLPKAKEPFLWPEDRAEKIGAVPKKTGCRTVLVSDRLFGQVVNSNLEVRTSVKIDPETGAASGKALFTYEAIPRSAILWFEVVEDDFRREFPTDNDKARELGHKCPLDVVRKGLELAEMLGIGGMGTRGFGRVRMLAGRKPA